MLSKRSWSTARLTVMASLLFIPCSSVLAQDAGNYPAAIHIHTEGACKTSNFPYKPASEVYVDSGKTFVLEGQSGSSCWNRLDNATSESPTSFAGASGKWYRFFGADCPAETGAVMSEWPMATGDPIRDVTCVSRPPLVVTCKTSNFRYLPASSVFVDSGRPFVFGEETGTTCWNRIDNAASATPSSFAGLGREWLIFSGADCPPSTGAVMFSAPKTSDDPIHDIGCVELGPGPAAALHLACEGPSMGFDSKGTYVDSGKRFSADGEMGTTCWNRARPEEATRAASFAGFGGEWMIFVGADCPPDSTSVAFSWTKSSDDPVADVPCVTRSDTP